MLPRHPTQLYEAVFHLLLAAGLLWLERHDRLRGQRIKLYILCYLGYRFASEFIRPEARFWFGPTPYQYGAIALVPIFVWLWRRDQRLLATVK